MIIKKLLLIISTSILCVVCCNASPLLSYQQDPQGDIGKAYNVFSGQYKPNKIILDGKSQKCYLLSQSYFRRLKNAAPLKSTSSIDYKVVSENSSAISNFSNDSSLQISYGKIEGNDTLKYINQHQNSDNSILLVSNAKYYQPHSIDASDIIINPAIVAGINNHSITSEQFISSCGTGFVSGYNNGAEALLAIKISSNSESSQKELNNAFSAKISSFANISNTVKSFTKKTNSSVSISASVYQAGGKSEKLMQYMNPSEYSFEKCSTDDVLNNGGKSCLHLMYGFQKYISDPSNSGFFYGIDNDDKSDKTTVDGLYTSRLSKSLLLSSGVNYDISNNIYEITEKSKDNFSYINKEIKKLENQKNIIDYIFKAINITGSEYPQINTDESIIGNNITLINNILDDSISKGFSSDADIQKYNNEKQNISSDTQSLIKRIIPSYIGGVRGVYFKCHDAFYISTLDGSSVMINNILVPPYSSNFEITIGGFCYDGSDKQVIGIRSKVVNGKTIKVPFIINHTENNGTDVALSNTIKWRYGVSGVKDSYSDMNTDIGNIHLDGGGNNTAPNDHNAGIYLRFT